MVKSGVYKITNPIGSIYIGHSKDIDKRFKSHTYKSTSTTKLRKSFDDYGVDNHIFEIVELCEEKDLNYRERYWQEFYNSIQDGLNSVLVSNAEKTKQRTKYDEPTVLTTFRCPISMKEEVLDLIYKFINIKTYEAKQKNIDVRGADSSVKY